MSETALPSPAPDGRSSRSWVRTIYLYLAALIGLILLTIGGIRLFDLALKATVFTQAEQEERMSYRQPPMPMILERVERLGRGEEAILEPGERAAIRQWLAEYERWKQQADRVDPIRSRRERDASTSLAFLLVGLPLYLYHWRTIKRDP